MLLSDGGSSDHYDATWLTKHANREPERDLSTFLDLVRSITVAQSPQRALSHAPQGSSSSSRACTRRDLLRAWSPENAAQQHVPSPASRMSPNLPPAVISKRDHLEAAAGAESMFRVWRRLLPGLAQSTFSQDPTSRGL